MKVNNPLQQSSKKLLTDRISKYIYGDLEDESLYEDVDKHNNTYKDNLSYPGMRMPSGKLFFLDLIYK